MPAGGQGQAHDGIAGLAEGEHDALVRLGAGMGLHIGEGAVEKLFGAVDGQLLHHVHVFAAGIVAPARIAFRVFVGQHRSLGLEHGAGDDVLRSDQLDLILLPVQLAGDGLGDGRIGLAQAGLEEAAGRRLPWRNIC
jgi:hypothetical protein